MLLLTVWEISLKKSSRFSANGEIPFRKSRIVFYFYTCKPLIAVDCGINFQVKISKPICSHVSMSCMWTKYLSHIFKKDLVSEVDSLCRMTALIKETSCRPTPMIHLSQCSDLGGSTNAGQQGSVAHSVAWKSGCFIWSPLLSYAPVIL